jgi:hypothetical protein
MTTNEVSSEIVNQKRSWMTGEEFLAQIEATRLAHQKAGHFPRGKFVPGPFVREYKINWNLEYTLKSKVAGAQKTEATP